MGVMYNLGIRGCGVADGTPFMPKEYTCREQHLRLFPSSVVNYCEVFSVSLANTPCPGLGIEKFYSLGGCLEFGVI